MPSSVGLLTLSGEAITAWATAAVAAVAFVQFGREVWREKVRRRTVTARISAMAYQLREELRAWRGDPEREWARTESDLDEWVRVAVAAGTLVGYLERATLRFDELMALRPDADRRTGSGLDRAYVFFVGGIRRIRERVGTTKPSETMAQYAWYRLIPEALACLSQCIDALENRVISVGFLIEEQKLATELKARDPLTQAGTEGSKGERER